MQSNGFDGVYLDGRLSSATWAEGRGKILGNMRVDTNGDGLPDSYTDIMAQCVLWQLLQRHSVGWMDGDVM